MAQKIDGLTSATCWCVVLPEDQIRPVIYVTGSSSCISSMSAVLFIYFISRFKEHWSFYTAINQDHYKFSESGMRYVYSRRLVHTSHFPVAVSCRGNNSEQLFMGEKIIPILCSDNLPVAAANPLNDLLLKNDFWISQGSVITCLRCGGQFHKRVWNFPTILHLRRLIF